MALDQSIIKIARDIDLTTLKQTTHVVIINAEQMNLTNHVSIQAADFTSFQEAVCGYGCDICGAHSNEQNPIYTNSKHQGCDICTNCINTALETISPMPGWNPGPVYSLKDIYSCIKK